MHHYNLSLMCSFLKKSEEAILEAVNWRPLQIFLKSPILLKVSGTTPYINFVPVPVFSLRNVKITMKLVVKYNSLKYAGKFDIYLGKIKISWNFIFSPLGGRLSIILKDFQIWCEIANKYFRLTILVHFINIQFSSRIFNK